MTMKLRDGIRQNRCTQKDRRKHTQKAIKMQLIGKYPVALFSVLVISWLHRSVDAIPMQITLNQVQCACLVSLL